MPIVPCLFFYRLVALLEPMIFLDYMHGRRQIVGEDKIATHTITPFAPPGGLSGSPIPTESAPNQCHGRAMIFSRTH